MKYYQPKLIDYTVFSERKDNFLKCKINIFLIKNSIILLICSKTVFKQTKIHYLKQNKKLMHHENGRFFRNKQRQNSYGHLSTIKTLKLLYFLFQHENTTNHKPRKKNLSRFINKVNNTLLFYSN